MLIHPARGQVNTIALGRLEATEGFIQIRDNSALQRVDLASLEVKSQPCSWTTTFSLPRMFSCYLSQSTHKRSLEGRRSSEDQMQSVCDSIWSTFVPCRPAACPMHLLPQL